MRTEYENETIHQFFHEVAAQTKREAVARVVARLGLEEERCATVNTWAVAEVKK